MKEKVSFPHHSSGRYAVRQCGERNKRGGASKGRPSVEIKNFLGEVEKKREEENISRGHLGAFRLKGHGPAGPVGKQISGETLTSWLGTGRITTTTGGKDRLCHSVGDYSFTERRHKEIKGARKKRRDLHSSGVEGQGGGK